MASTVEVLSTDGDDLVLLSAKLVSLAQTSVGIVRWRVQESWQIMIWHSSY